MASKKGRTKCEVWSRVAGYLRPTARWNDGKLAEFFDRMTFRKKKKNEGDDEGDDSDKDKEKDKE